MLIPYWVRYTSCQDHTEFSVLHADTILSSVYLMLIPYWVQYTSCRYRTRLVCFMLIPYTVQCTSYFTSIILRSMYFILIPCSVQCSSYQYCTHLCVLDSYRSIYVIPTPCALQCTCLSVCIDICWCLLLLICSGSYSYTSCSVLHSKKSVQDVLASGRLCFLDVEINGVKSIKASNMRPKPRFIFVKPPSYEALVRFQNIIWCIYIYTVQWNTEQKTNSKTTTKLSPNNKTTLSPNNKTTTIKSSSMFIIDQKKGRKKSVWSSPGHWHLEFSKAWHFVVVVGLFHACLWRGAGCDPCCRMWGRGELYLMLHCHHQNDSAFRWAVVWAILMFQ